MPRHIFMSYLRPAKRLAAAVAFGSCLAVAHASLGKSGEAGRYYEDALARYERADVPGAIIQLRNALKVDRNLLPVHLLLGKALLANGEVAAAEVALAEAMRLGVNRAETVVPLAHALIQQGKHQRVLSEAVFRVEGLSGAQQVELLLLKASAASDLGQSSVAMQYIDAARARDAQSAAPWMSEVAIHIRAGQMPQAESAARKAMALAPDSAEAHYLLGSVQHVQGRIDQALDTYGRALNLDARHLEALVARAGVHLDLDRRAEAGKDVAQALAVSPQEPRALYLKALLAERNGDTPGSRQALREVTRFLDPVPMDFLRYRPQLLMLNGLAHYGLGEPEKTKPYLEGYQKAVGPGPTSKLLARIHLSESNPGLAAELLEAYLRKVPGDVQATTLLASALMAQGHQARAIALMRTAVKDRDLPELRTALGIGLARAGGTAEAITQMEAALAKDPTRRDTAASLVGLYLRDGRTSKAVELAAPLARRHPTDPVAHNLHGMALWRVGKAAPAREAFEQAARVDPQFLPAQLNLARVDLAAQSLDAAGQRLDRLMREHDKDPEVLIEAARLAHLRGRPEEAVRWLEKGELQAGPGAVQAGLALVDLLLRSQRLDDALEASKRLQAKAPEDVRVLLLHARTQVAAGDAPGARLTLGHATRYAEFDPAAQVEIARLQMAAGNPSGAAYSLDKALAGDPAHLGALALSSEIELARGNTQTSERLARRIIDLYPKKAAGHLLLGRIHTQAGRAGPAVAAFQQAHGLEPTSATALGLFNAMAHPPEGLQQALQFARRWSAAHPSDVPMRRAVADTLARQRQFAAARQAYEDVLRLAPADPAALNNLANVLLQLKDPGAASVAQKAWEAARTDPKVIDTLGWALFQAGELDRAITLLREARLRAPASPTIRYHLGAALAQAGRTAEAKAELDAALQAPLRQELAQEASRLRANLP